MSRKRIVSLLLAALAAAGGSVLVAGSALAGGNPSTAGVNGDAWNG